MQPELQRFVAKLMGAKTYEIDTSHVPMLSQPALAIDVSLIEGDEVKLCHLSSESQRGQLFPHGERHDFHVTRTE